MATAPDCGSRLESTAVTMLTICPDDHGDRRKGSVSLYVPLRVGGKIVVPESLAY